MESLQMQSHQSRLKIRSIYFWVFAPGILSVIITIASYLLGTVDRNLVFNSDSMYIPMLFDDLFEEGGNLSSWYLTPAPGFFPDMLLFFISRFFVRNTLLNFTLFAALQVGLSYLISLLMIQNFEADQTKKVTRSFVFGVFFLTAIALFSFRGNVPYVHIFFPVYRFGAIFNILILTTCIFWTFNTHQKLANLSIGLICLLATATDMMFLPMAVVPAIASIILVSWLSKVSFRDSIIWILIIISSSFFGWFFKHLITKNTMSHYIGFGYTSFPGQIKLLVHLIYESFVQNIFIAVIILGFYLLIFFNFFSLLKSFRKQPQNVNSQKELYISLFLISSPVVTSVVVLLNGVISGAIHELRYISNFYWLPIFFSWVALRPSWIPHRRLSLFLICWITFTGLQLFSVPTSGLITDYYPSLVKCIDSAVSDYSKQTGEELDEGLSLYWEAKLVTHFSRENLSVLQVVGDLSPFLWILNEDWYTDQVYDFAVLAHNSPQPELGPTVPYLPSKDIIVSLNGQPKATQICSSADGRDFEIMLYGAEKLRVRL